MLALITGYRQYRAKERIKKRDSSFDSIGMERRNITGHAENVRRETINEIARYSKDRYPTKRGRQEKEGKVSRLGPF